MLELLSDVGKVQLLTETRERVEGLSGLRAKILDELLRHTTRIKVVRMAANLASSMKLPLATLAGNTANASGAAHAGSRSADPANAWS
jgi:hypothetical protein